MLFGGIGMERKEYSAEMVKLLWQATIEKSKAYI